MPVLVFDIETIPDVAGIRAIENLPAGLSDFEVAEWAFQQRRASHGNDFLPHHLQRVVAISCVLRDAQHFRVFSLSEPERVDLSTMDVIHLRQDPPFDMEYIYTTYLLELAEKAGTLVVNQPRSLRDANEKFFALNFPHCCPPTLVSREPARLKGFLAQHADVVVKPLDGMGGASVFRLRQDDPNLNVILETLTAHGRRLTMAQRYIPEVTAGDKRILLIDGEPVPYALARIPQAGETRANLAAGGRGEGVPLSERDRWICAQVAPTLRAMGLLFVGLDVIGDYLTEINVTSPTCARELDAQFGLDIGGDLMAAIERQLGR